MAGEIDSDDDEDMIFRKAREFLQFVGRTFIQNNTVDDSGININTAVHIQSNKSNEKCLKRKMAQFGAVKKKKIKVENTEHHTLTSHKRKKLERIKAPVTSFVKPAKPTEVQKDDDGESVNKMFDHMRKLPEQDVYSPPYIPMVFIPKQDEEGNNVYNTCTSPEVLEYIYLSSEKDLATWKMLNNSLTNRNVFLGNLSYKVDQFVLKSVFETLVVKEQRHLLKVRLVTDPLSGVSKGYGFVEFPYRRAAELSLICLQGFELFGREMQLGWGQGNGGERSQDFLKNHSETRAVISDYQCAKSKDHVTCKRKRQTRWYAQQRRGENTEKSEPFSQCVDVSQSSRVFPGENTEISLSQHRVDVIHGSKIVPGETTKIPLSQRVIPQVSQIVHTKSLSHREGVSQDSDIFLGKNNDFLIHNGKVAVSSDENRPSFITRSLINSEEKEQSRRLSSSRLCGTTGTLVEQELSTIHKRTSIEWLSRKQRVDLDIVSKKLSIDVDLSV